jgi:hypothetical protein
LLNNPSSDTRSIDTTKILILANMVDVTLDDR